MADVAADTDTGDASSSSTPPTINNTLQQSTVAEQAIRSTFLALFLIIGFVGNSVLIATIAQSNQLKAAVMNLLIISIATVNLIDCIVNMPLILGASISEKWDYGEFSCRLNTFCVQLVSVTMLAGLCIMSVDRFVSVKNTLKYSSRMTAVKINILIVCCWTFGLGLSLPIVINVVSSMIYPARYLCSIAGGSSLIYITLVSVLGYLIPIVIILVLYILIIKYSFQGKRRYSHTEGEESADGKEFSDHVDAAKYVGLLVILWCFFEGPFLLLTSIEQYRNSDRLHPIAQDLLNFQYPWQLDVTFTWLKLSYAIMLPVITFFWRKEVWIKLKNCCKCNRHKRNKHKKDNAGKNSATNSLNSKNKKKEQFDVSVPVLFATENGLHFQAGLNDDSDEEGNVFPPDSENNNSASIASNVRTRKCDVLGSGFIQQQENEDTSDYDSQNEVDPFSGSNPISIKSKESQVTQGSHGSSKLHANAERRNQNSSEQGGNARLTTSKLQEDLQKSLQEYSSNDIKKPPKGRKKERKNNKNDSSESKVISPLENGDNESLRTRSDSGNGSWDKVKGKKKTKLKKRKDHVIEIDNETVDAHTTDDIDDPNDHQNVQPASEKAEDTSVVDVESNNKKKKRKKKKIRKKSTDEMDEDKDSKVVYENEAFNVVDEETDIVPARTKKTINSQMTTEDQDNLCFQKVNKRHLPKPPIERRFSDDTDIAFMHQQEANHNHGGKSPNHGAKTARAHMRSLSHDFLIDGDDKDTVSHTTNFRPQPNPRKSKSRISNMDNSELVIQDETSPRNNNKKHKVNGKNHVNALEGNSEHLEEESQVKPSKKRKK